ncbi:MAG: LptF/LptG family permease [Armatimonadota bacterium]|nr:LptF/LptG family permease [Armatimonadota bacterium]MDR7403476.1 LptF/LptG family permease [Armatimonadota bacterium]
MPIVDRYIILEILPPFLLGVGGFAVLLVGDILYTLAEFIVSGRLTLQALGRLLAYKLPAIMVITFPVSTLLGVLLGLGRLARDRELQAMRLAGMSLGRLFAPALVFALGMAAVTFLTNEYFAPWANHRANTLIRRAAFGEAFPQVREQVFFRAPGNRFFYVERVDDDRRLLQNVMVYEVTPPLPRLITAREGRWDDRYWRLRDGVLREFDSEGFTRYEARFDEMRILVNLPGGIFFAGQKTPDEMTAAELRQYLAAFGREAPPRFAIELHRKFAIPAASVVFALVAAPLSLLATQGGRFTGVGISVVLLFLYYAVMSSARAVGAVGAVSPMLAAWLPNLLFGVGGLVIWARQDRWLHRAPATSG